MNAAPESSVDFGAEDNARLAAVCGPLDENLQQIENRLGVEIRRRSGRFTLRGANAAAGAAVLRQLYERAAGKPVLVDANPNGLADGLLSVKIGTRNFHHLEAHLDEVVMIEDERLLPAMRFLMDRMKLVAEPSGAITVAALLDGVVKPQGPTVAICSGGNIEYDGFTALLGTGA